MCQRHANRSPYFKKLLLGQPESRGEYSQDTVHQRLTWRSAPVSARSSAPRASVVSDRSLLSASDKLDGMRKRKDELEAARKEKKVGGVVKWAMPS